MLVMIQEHLLVCITFRPGMSAANGQLVTPGWVVSTCVTSEDPFIEGKFMSVVLVTSPTLSLT